MHAHICDQISISAICSVSSISRSSLQALFYEKEGCGAITHFHALKIAYAKELIRSGSMNFTEIACHLSYSSLQYFSKRFKKATGMSPMAYASSVKALSNVSTQKHKHL